MPVISNNLDVQNINVSLVAETVAEVEYHHKEKQHVHHTRHRQLKVYEEQEEVRHEQ